MKSVTRLFTALVVVSLFVSSAFAQLSITSELQSALAASIQTSAVDQATLRTNWPLAPSVSVGGYTFDQVSFNLGDIVVGKGALGEFSADVYYVGKDSIDFNSLGVSDGALSTLLYNPYSTASFSQGFHITANTYTTADFFHIDGAPHFGGVKWQDDPLHFSWYETVDVSKNLILDLAFVDDRGSEYIDYNDGVFLITRNLEPTGFTPVPEPSTYGVVAGLLLTALAVYRRRKLS